MCGAGWSDMQLNIHSDNNNNNKWNLYSAFHDTQRRFTEKQIDKQKTKDTENQDHFLAFMFGS